MAESPRLDDFSVDLARLRNLLSEAGGPASPAPDAAEVAYLRAKLAEAAAALVSNRPFLREALDKIRTRLGAPAEAARAEDPGQGELKFYELLVDDAKARATRELNDAPSLEPSLQARLAKAVADQFERLRLEQQCRFFRQPLTLMCLSILAIAMAFALFGVVRWQDQEINIATTIEAKRDQLLHELDEQREATRKLTSELDSARATAEAGASSVDRQLVQAKSRVDNLEADADRVIANFTRDIHQRYDGKFDDALNRLDIDLQKTNEAAKATLTTETKAGAKRISDAGEQGARSIADAASAGAGKIADSATERANALSAQPPNPVFSERLKTLQTSTERSSADLGLLRARFEELSSKQALLSKATAAAFKPTQPMVERLAGYINEAVWFIYGFAVLLLILICVQIWLMFRAKLG
jgi:hypothetical protein